ncbi:MAG: hypothetical protein SFV22_09390 [Saprospiraceae bacterium]|nr:hypothetical protein [Saprospiraceae bacterium]
MFSKIALFFLLPMPFGAMAQQTSPLFGAGQPSPSVNVNASDGVYDKFVLIRWEPAEKAGEYRVFRAVSPAGASMVELTRVWQKSTWFCDYSAEKGRDYYYAVMSSDGKNTAPLSRFDKGYLKKEDKYANDESLSAIEPDKYAAGKQVFVLVADMKTSGERFQSGDELALSIGLQNIFDEPTPRTDIRILLSKDPVWDFDDVLLSSKSYSGFPATMKATLSESFRLPDNLVAGDYYLIAVASPEGNILQAKIGALPIKITQP